MALGDPYASRSDLKTYLGIGDTTDDAKADLAIDVASRSIEGDMGRQFNLDTGVTTRIYYATSMSQVYIDDISTATGFVLKTDADDDGTFETTWVAADYQLCPLNGVVDGSPGWPYWYIQAVGSRLFPVTGRPDFSGPNSGPVWRFYFTSTLPAVHRRPGVSVTATFGFPSVPGNVKQACLLLAEEIFKLKDAPFGVAGFAEFGAVRVRENPKVAALLQRYTRSSVKFA